MVKATEIKTDNYNVSYDSATLTVNWRGSLRLNSMEEYAQIMQLLSDLIEQAPPVVTLNLQELVFLNSSGINALSKFVIKVRERGNIALRVQGSKQTPWQGKSLKNLQRLMPSLTLELV